jgi:ParB family chromosome partitioning protein
MEKKPEKKGLGRGLSALMSDVNLGVANETAPRRADMRLPVERLRPNPLQPRKDFEAEALESLADSIRQKGVIQPLIVRPVGEDYEIVAGERRWRAAQLAQQHDVPVVVRDLDDTEVLEVAIIENIQREDLNAIEEAMGLRQLMDRFGHTQEKIAEALSKSRSHIANLLRLLSLPGSVQSMVRDGKLTAGHARALVGAENAEQLALTIAQRGLSVREVEKLVRQEARSTKSTKTTPRKAEKDPDTRALEADLSAHLGMVVQIDMTGTGESGQLIVRFGSLDDLDKLCQGLSTVSTDLAH